MPPSTNTFNRDNFRHLYIEIFWFGMLSGSAIAFLPIYATRLGASGLEISLLTAGPALINLIFSLPAGRWLEHLPLIHTNAWSAALQRLGYLALVFLPLLFHGKVEISAIILVYAAMSIPATLQAIGFNALFAEVVPLELRGEVVGKRNALLAVSLTGGTLLSGLILDHILFPINYQIVFGIGALGAGLSTFHLSRLKAPFFTDSDSIVPQTSRRFWLRPFNAGPVRSQKQPTSMIKKPLLRRDLLHGRSGLVLLGYLIFYTFQYFPLALFPLYYVHNLKLTDGEISLGSGLFYAIMLLTSLRLGNLSARWRHQRLLQIGAISFFMYPLLLGLAKDATLFWIGSFVGGAVWAILNAGLLNRLIEVTPDNDRPAYLAMHNLAFNLGILGGSLLGPAVSANIGLQEAVLFGAGLRLIAGLVLIAWG